MYENFFSFREKPFKLVPNPAYLFLSRSHEEALAHLNYALAQGDGFVEITGEVGTGKTTLCRAFLDTLEPDTHVAYIFNPRLGPKQLIKTINDELGIKYDTNNTKDLIDQLNAFLMRKKTERKKVILLIDEAQNLDRNVLEQLRLLSNLETNKEKLLQIILVGQPELSDILDSHDLRQLGQRIALRYYLTPLNFNETVEYIRYRISIASQKSSIKFTHSAFRQIFRYSGGIPRVINIACDRALLTAFGLNQYKITGRITREAIRELSSRGTKKRLGLTDRKKALVAIAVFSMVLFAAIYHQPLLKAIRSIFIDSDNQQLQAAAPTASEERAPEDLDQTPDIPEPVEVEADKPPADLKQSINFSDYLMTMDHQSSRISALKLAMKLWDTPIEFKPYLNNLDDDQSFFRLTAKPSGLIIQRIEADLDMLMRLNLPAILEVWPPGSSEPGYLTLSKINGDTLTFGETGGENLIETDANEINFYWSGVAYVPWKNFLAIWGTIPVHSNGDSVITLKMLLNDLGFSNIDMNENYDDWTRKAVEEIQAKYGIPVDGFVGPLTKIILYRENNSFDMPYLTN